MSIGLDPADSPSCSPIAPMAHGDLHRLTLPHLRRHVPVSGRLAPRVLDLGAGSGGMSQLMQTAGYRVEACDLEPPLFQYPAVACRRADLTERLPYDDASFDGVVCVEVLEHIDGHERLFREVERVLKPGGVFLFTTPNVMSIKSRLSFLWTGFEHSFYPLEVGEQTPQQWHISGYGGNRYRFVLGLTGLELREVACDKLSRTSLVFAWLAPLIWLRSWLRHRGAVGARFNNSLAALFGRTMIGIAKKNDAACATARGGGEELTTPLGTACFSTLGQPIAASSAESEFGVHRGAASSGTPNRPNGLTVIIPCKNEREHIRACILSAQQVADEVLVADSGSTDGTLEIARELGCRIIEREYGTSGDFKNWAIPQAAHEWVLILDADERVTPRAGRRNSPRAVRPAARRLLDLSPQSFSGSPDSLRPVEKRPLPAAVSPRPGSLRRSDRSCRSGADERHGGPAAGADDALHVHILRAVFAEAGALRRRAVAHLARAGSADDTPASCCCGFRCDSCKATCGGWDFSTAWPGCRCACWWRTCPI